MPIFVSSPCGGKSGGDHAIGECTGITGKMFSGKVQLNWSDPPDAGNVKWAGTKVVRKIGSLPTSPTDGTIVIDNTVRDRYASTVFMDTVSAVSTASAIYYRFFPYTADGMFTYGNNSAVVYAVDYVLENNSWSAISAMAKTRHADEVWGIGDTKSLTLTGTYAQTLDVQIADINYSSGPHKANMVFITKGLLKDNVKIHSTSFLTLDISDVLVKGMPTDMNSTVLPSIYSGMPVELQNVIKDGSSMAQGSLAYDGGTSGIIADGIYTKVQLPSIYEMVGHQDIPQLKIFEMMKKGGCLSFGKGKNGFSGVYSYWLREFAYLPVSVTGDGNYLSQRTVQPINEVRIEFWSPTKAADDPDIGLAFTFSL